MGMFSSKTSYVGVDVGSASIKMVELAAEGRQARLVSYGYAEQPTDVIRTESKEVEQRIIGLIQKIHRESRMTSKKVVAALPTFSVFSSILSLPAMKKKELSEAIQWEAKKFIPMPLEEMVLDWKIVEERRPGSGEKKGKEKNADQKIVAPPAPPPTLSALEKKPIASVASREEVSASPTAALAEKQQERIVQKKKNIKILITAAPKNLVDRYLRIFLGAGMELLSLETESFAIERALVGKDTSSIMIVDIGAVSSDIIIVENGLPVLTRSIDVGGISITNAIVKSLGIDVQRAEQFKRDIGFSKDSTQGIPKMIETTMSPIINEIKYAFDLFFSQKEGGHVEKIILTGGSAYLPNIVEYLSSLLDIKVIIGDSWARVAYPLDIKPALEEVAPRFSVAVGLALREIE